MNPSRYIPKAPAEFIGPAARLAGVLERKAIAARETGEPMKLLVIGEPGIGKTRIVDMVAARLASLAVNVESVNGRNVGADTVRRWSESSCYRALAGGFNVKVINELDTMPAVAQDILLSYLDALPDYNAVLATSNARLDQLSARFQSRFQQFRLAIPGETEIAALLETFGVNGQSAKIAAACRGNVRAALLDAQSVLDCQSPQF